MVVDTTYYDLLEVAVDADEVTIKKAFRRMAIKFHPDKNPDDPKGAAEHFQKISEAYQVISNSQLRIIYDKHGREEAIPEKGFEDATAFFTTIFGGEAFLDIVGEISLIKDLTHAMQIAENDFSPTSSTTVNKSIENSKAFTNDRPKTSEGDKSRKKITKEKRREYEMFEEKRKQKREERIDILSKKLIEKLSLWTESEKSSACTNAFKQKIKLEAENLKMESFGVEMLHAIGATYLQKANICLKSQKYLGFSSVFSRMKEKGQVVRDIWITISSAFDATHTVEQISKLEETGGDDWTPEARAILEREASSKMLFASWKGTKLEIQDVLRRVCVRVLDEAPSKNKKIERAIALKLIAEEYLAVIPDEDDPARVMEQLMAEAQMNKQKT